MIFIGKLPHCRHGDLLSEQQTFSNLYNFWIHTYPKLFLLTPFLSSQSAHRGQPEIIHSTIMVNLL